MIFNRCRNRNRDRHTHVWEPVEEYWPGRLLVYHYWTCAECGKREFIGVEHLEDIKK